MVAMTEAMGSPHDIADVATIAAAKRADRDAMASLWRTYQPQVLRFLATTRVPAADDVASQTWIDVARGLADFEGDGVAFQRWIFTIARRRGIDEVRRRQRRTDLVARAHHDANDQGAQIDADAVTGLDHAVQLVRQLPTDMAEAVMLRVVWDLSVTDAAEIMERSEGNVRVLVHRGLTRLRAAMQPSSDIDDRVDQPAGRC